MLVTVCRSTGVAGHQVPLGGGVGKLGMVDTHTMTLMPQFEAPGWAYTRRHGWTNFTKAFLPVLFCYSVIELDCVFQKLIPSGNFSTAELLIPLPI